jgi:hypothetical protein
MGISELQSSTQTSALSLHAHLARAPKERNFIDARLTKERQTARYSPHLC